MRECSRVGEWDFPGGSDGKASAYSVGDPGSIPGSRRSPGEGNGTPLQYSCLENPMDGGAWWAAVHGSQRVGEWMALGFSLRRVFRWTQIWKERTYLLVQPSPGNPLLGSSKEEKISRTYWWREDFLGISWWPSGYASTLSLLRVGD